LSGVSAGVIGLDAEARINLPNQSASHLLGIDLRTVIGTPLAQVVPEMAELIAASVAVPDHQQQAQVRLVRGNRTLTFIARIVTEKVGTEVMGYVLTFDDISPLVQAERKAAWADVARRIAHEIKNPLTPIQLASERLRRKYMSEIKTDPATFAACTETIIRQVEDIGRMVDEFSAFARMPRPELKPEDLGELIEKVVFLERNRHREIDIVLALPKERINLVCDGRQVAQALTNVLKNAAEAIVAREPGAAGAPPPGWIGVSLKPEEGDAKGLAATIVIEDNGRGLPKENRDRLTEPYVTTHSKGTGLGLAIVKKIMEDHGGELVLEDKEGGGARVMLRFAAALGSAVPSSLATERSGDSDRSGAAAAIAVRADV
ncbi:MAG TPA: ATP-binding protein, partial [Defluviicoccus sp.]|nr:ATP-binding protein [Defluviicoccus sp.]